MTARQGGVNRSLLLVLAIAGLVAFALSARGCIWTGAGWRFMDLPWMRHWEFGVLGPLTGMFGLWGLIQIGLAIWVGVDANRRGLGGLLWGLLVFFTSVVGLIVYLLVAPTLEQRNGTANAAPPPAAGERCPACGRPVRDDFKACPHCGGRLRRECGSCGRRLEADWKLCPYCEARD